VMRVVTDRTNSYYRDTACIWDPVMYHGFKFDGTYPVTTEATDVGRDNFLGPISDKNTYSGVYGIELNSGHYTPSRIIESSSIHPSYNLYNGMGTVLDDNLQGSTSGDRAFCIPNGSAGAYTQIWRVTGSPLNNTVYLRSWVNADSIDLTTFDITTDLDPDSPTTFFPASQGTFRYRTLQGDVTGTNWRPLVDGIMAFPTYFMACHPSVAFNMHIPYVGVHYSESTI